MKYLTKTISRKFRQTSSLSRETWSLAQRLGQPRNYLNGWPSCPIILPRRLLLFTRNHRPSLLAGGIKAQHHRFVFITVFKGDGRVCVDERIFPLVEGSSLLIFPFQLHHYLPGKGDSIRWLFITFEVDDATFLEGLRNRPCKGGERFLFELNRFVPRTTPTPDQTTGSTLWLLLMLRDLTQSILRKREITVSPDPKDEMAQTLLECVNRFLHHNMTRPFKLKELSRECGYSESHLRSLFRQHIHISLGEYLAEARLRKATGLLHQGTMNITEISESCGYGSLYAFSRVFRQRLGLSPRDYRKKLVRDASSHFTR